MLRWHSTEILARVPRLLVLQAGAHCPHQREDERGQNIPDGLAARSHISGIFVATVALLHATHNPKSNSAAEG